MSCRCIVVDRTSLIWLNGKFRGSWYSAVRGPVLRSPHSTPARAHFVLNLICRVLRRGTPPQEPEMASPGSGPAHPFAWPTGSRERTLSGKEFDSACDSWPRTAWSWSFTAWDCGTDRTRRNLLTPRVTNRANPFRRFAHESTAPAE